MQSAAEFVCKRTRTNTSGRSGSGCLDPQPSSHQPKRTVLTRKRFKLDHAAPA